MKIGIIISALKYNVCPAEIYKKIITENWAALYGCAGYFNFIPIGLIELKL